MKYSEQILQATQLLHSAKETLNVEINNYPTPIAGCDAQFNYLLAERTKVDAALRKLRQDVFIPTPRQLNPNDKIEVR